LAAKALSIEATGALLNSTMRRWPLRFQRCRCASSDGSPRHHGANRSFRNPARGRCSCGGSGGGGEPIDFDFIVAHYCQCSGEPWTDELEATLTMPRILARQEYWKKCPSTHLLVRNIAIWAGAFKPEPEPSKSVRWNDSSSLEELRSLFPSGIIS
jgi:hypothetical protein